MRRLSKLGGDVNDQVSALARPENENVVQRLRRVQWHPIKGNGPAFHADERQDEDPRIGSIDQSQAQAFVLPHIERQIIFPIRRDEVAASARVTAIVSRSEIGIDLRGLGIEKPIVQDQNLVAIHIESLGLLDDQRAVKSASDLLNRPIVRVIPIGPGIGCDEVVIEAFARFDGGLGQPCDAVHRVVDPDAVPVDRACLRQFVQEPSLNPCALRDP